MTKTQWEAFQDFRDRFKIQCLDWSQKAESPPAWLATLQKEATLHDRTPVYPIETPIVYNTTLDSITEKDDIKLILTGDNPGKNEQLQENQKYLVGLSGKLGDGFFKKNPELEIDFRQNVLILNKSPIHTAKTKQLSFLRKFGGEPFIALLDETQIWMARETVSLQNHLSCPHWIVGYGELREKGIFSVYARELTKQNIQNSKPNTYLYQHFSMNRFSIDLAQQSISEYSLTENLVQIGLRHRKEILHW